MSWLQCLLFLSHAHALGPFLFLTYALVEGVRITLVGSLVGVALAELAHVFVVVVGNVVAIGVAQKSTYLHWRHLCHFSSNIGLYRPPLSGKFIQVHQTFPLAKWDIRYLCIQDGSIQVSHWIIFHWALLLKYVLQNGKNFKMIFIQVYNVISLQSAVLFLESFLIISDVNQVFHGRLSII